MNNLVGVIVDAGHGGEDPGAVSGGLREKDFTLEAALYMYDRLKELGIDARLTREGDTSLPKSQRIAKVKELFNNSSNVILVSNHINAGGGEGAEIVYSLRNNPTLASMALDNIESAGQIARGIYQRVLPENPSKDYYYILRESGNVEPILVEYGFIDNVKDANKLQTKLTDYVEGVVKAIADYAGVTYTPPGTTPGIPSNTYTVKRGDTLYSIAAKYNLTVNELKSLNNLTNNTLQIGQVLKISNQTTDLYKVERGDTLYSIASRFDTTVDEIKTLNNLANNTLYIGQELLIPILSSTTPNTPQPPVLPDTPNVPVNPDTTGYDTYTVVKGDSLWGISQRFDISVDDLIDINNLSGTTLQIGDILLVPKQEQRIHTVVSGDTIFMGNNEYYNDLIF